MNKMIVNKFSLQYKRKKEKKLLVNIRKIFKNYPNAYSYCKLIKKIKGSSSSWTHEVNLIRFLSVLLRLLFLGELHVMYFFLAKFL